MEAVPREENFQRTHRQFLSGMPMLFQARAEVIRRLQYRLDIRLADVALRHARLGVGRKIQLHAAAGRPAPIAAAPLQDRSNMLYKGGLQFQRFQKAPPGREVLGATHDVDVIVMGATYHGEGLGLICHGV